MLGGASRAWHRACVDASKEEVATLAQCEVCGNDYDKSFEIVMMGVTHVFDSFECAIHALAPRCGHCGCSIIGHGLESEGSSVEAKVPDRCGTHVLSE